MRDAYIQELLAASPEEQAQWVEAMALHSAPPGDFMAGFAAQGAQPQAPQAGFAGMLQPTGVQQAGPDAPTAAYVAPQGQAPMPPPVAQLFRS